MNEVLTDAQFAARLSSCNWKDAKSVSDIVSATHTNVKFNEIILKKQMEVDGAATMFQNFFGTRNWGDGQGMDEVREYSTPPYIPISFQYFIEKLAPCKDGNRDDCDWDSCVIPEGGRGTLPGFQLFRIESSPAKESLRPPSASAYIPAAARKSQPRLTSSVLPMEAMLAARTWRSSR